MTKKQIKNTLFVFTILTKLVHFPSSIVMVRSAHMTALLQPTSLYVPGTYVVGHHDDRPYTSVYGHTHTWSGSCRLLRERRPFSRRRWSLGQSDPKHVAVYSYGPSPTERVDLLIFSTGTQSVSNETEPLVWRIRNCTTIWRTKWLDR